VRIQWDDERAEVLVFGYEKGKTYNSGKIGEGKISQLRKDRRGEREGKGLGSIVNPKR